MTEHVITSLDDLYGDQSFEIAQKYGLLPQDILPSYISHESFALDRAIDEEDLDVDSATLAFMQAVQSAASVIVHSQFAGSYFSRIVFPGLSAYERSSFNILSQRPEFYIYGFSFDSPDHSSLERDPESDYDFLLSRAQNELREHADYATRCTL